MTGQGSLGYVIFYVSFFVAIAFIGNIASNAGVSVSSDVQSVPSLDTSNLTIISSLLFVFDIVVYFVGLQGLTVLGLPAGIGAIIGLVSTIGLVYVIARLVRGGG